MASRTGRGSPYWSCLTPRCCRKLKTDIPASSSAERSGASEDSKVNAMDLLVVASGGKVPAETRPMGSTSARSGSSAGSTPACSSEVFPTPDTPYSTVSLLERHIAATSCDSCVLPKETTRDLPRRNARRPTKGGGAWPARRPECAVIRTAPFWPAADDRSQRPFPRKWICSSRLGSASCTLARAVPPP